MHSIIGMVVGVALILCIVGLMALFVWLSMRLDLGKDDLVIGAFGTIAVLLLIFFVAVKLSGGID